MRIEVTKSLPPILNLSFKGCGIKWLAYIGAIDALSEHGKLDRVERVIGSSGGAIMATMFALGYSSEELKNKYLNLDYTQFREDKWFSKIPILGRVIAFFYNIYCIFFTERSGVIEGKELLALTRQMVNDKLGSHDATFGDLHAAVQDNAAKNTSFKDLYITTINLTQSRLNVFSYETHPNAKIAESVLAAIAYPLTIQSVVLTRDTHDIYTGKIPSSTDALDDIEFHIDGGLFNNEPREYFDRWEYKPKGYRYTDSNPATLSFRMDVAAAFDVALWNRNARRRPGDDLLSAYVDAMTSGNHVSNQNGMTTIQIRDPGIDVLDFDLDAKKTKTLYDAGYEAGHAWCHHYSETHLSSTDNCNESVYYAQYHFASLHELMLADSLTFSEKISILTRVLETNHQDAVDPDVYRAQQLLSMFPNDYEHDEHLVVTRIEESELINTKTRENPSRYKHDSRYAHFSKANRTQEIHLVYKPIIDDGYALKL